MQIKVNPAKKQDSDSRKWKSFRNVMSGSGKRKTSFKVFLAFIIIFLFYSSAMFAFGVLVQRNLGFSNLVAKPILLDNFDILVRYVNSMFVQPEVLNIDITYKNYQKLEYARKCALASGTLYEVPNEWVNAKIRYGAEAALARLTSLGKGKVRIEFTEAQSSPTPGQAVVIYRKDTVLGGGWIRDVEG